MMSAALRFLYTVYYTPLRLSRKAALYSIGKINGRITNLFLLMKAFVESFSQKNSEGGA